MRDSRLLVSSVVVGVVTLCVGVSANADPVVIPVGPPVAGSSWSYAWTASAGGPGIGYVDMFIVSGGTFSSPAFQSFRDGADVARPSWTLYFEDSTTAYSTGNAAVSSTLKWDSHFAGVINNPNLIIDIVLYNPSDAYLASFIFKWDGVSNWAYQGSGGNPGTSHLIPLPTGAAMAMVGMGVIGVRRRRNPISQDS